MLGDIETDGLSDGDSERLILGEMLGLSDILIEGLRLGDREGDKLADGEAEGEKLGLIDGL